MKPDAHPFAADSDFFTSLLQSDVESLDRLMADDFLLIDVLRGDQIAKSELLNAVRSGHLKFDVIEPVETYVRRYERTVIVTGVTRMGGYFGEVPFSVQSRYTHVFVEGEDRWYFVSAQGTSISPDHS
jgi:hypothetical protein